MSDANKIAALREFGTEFAWAIKTIPSEMASQWRDAHRWNRDKGEYVIIPDGNHQSMIYVPDSDYAMWRRLGGITDALLLVIAVAILFLVVQAVSYL